MVKEGYKKYGFLGNLVYSRIAMRLSVFFIKLGFGPNAVSVIGFILFLVGCCLLTSDEIPVSLLGFAILHLGVVLDYADGIVARSTNRTSFFGAWFDNSLDRLADFVIMLPIAVNIVANKPPINHWLISLVVANIFAVCYFHYLHDIGYFYRTSTTTKSQVHGTGRAGSGSVRLAVSAWLRVFNRDTIVFILSISLLLKVFFVPFVFVFIVAFINIMLISAAEVIRKA